MKDSGRYVDMNGVPFRIRSTRSPVRRVMREPRLSGTSRLGTPLPLKDLP